MCVKANKVKEREERKVEEQHVNIEGHYSFPPDNYLFIELLLCAWLWYRCFRYISEGNKDPSLPPFTGYIFQ
jgi:hypothetical protein